MAEIKSEFDLMRILALKLAGRYCAVNIKQPATTGSWATLQVRPDGVPEVHITPFIDEDQALSSYLHELAHIRLHADQMVPSSTHTAAPRSITVTKEQKQVTRSWEQQADALRDEWLQYGKTHADPSLPEHEGILWALMDYYK